MTETEPHPQNVDVVCDAHGTLAEHIVYESVEDLVGTHREAFGCYYPIRLFAAEDAPPTKQEQGFTWD